MTIYTGTWAHDTFVGTGGNDIFRNIAGGDKVDGGAGWDIISIDLSYTDIAVNYNAIAAATAAGTAPLQYMSVRNVEQLGVLRTGGGDDSLTISSAQGAFTWFAGAGTDTLNVNFSGALKSATATFTVDGYTLHTDQWGSSINAYASDIERVIITGSRFADDLRGTDGDDILKGWDGDDFLETGAAGKDLIDGGTGTDTVAINYYLSTFDIVYDATQAATATGVTLGNGTVIRNVEHFDLTGGDGNDSVTTGTAQGAFLFIGNGGSNTLIADYSDAASAITTTWLASTPLGTDLRIVSDDFGGMSADSYQLSALTLTGSAFNDHLQGTSGNDVLKGGAGDDVLDPGTGGNDEIDGGDGFDRLQFDFSSVTTRIDVNARGMDYPVYGTNLKVGDRNIHITNVEGLGTIKTGAGDDRLQVDDSVGTFTWWAGAGSDELFVDYRSAHNALNISNVASPDGWMTQLYVKGTPVTDTAQAYQIESLTVYGTWFDDSLQGTNGNDMINGWNGADRMEGLGGNDVYVVDNSGDTVIERLNGGIDTVSTDLSYVLTDNVENLTLGGYADVTGTGNALDNVVFGNQGGNVLSGLAGNDTLDGQAGADTLIGGLGNDTYFVDNAQDLVVERSGQGKDTIVASIDYRLSDNVENLTLTGTAVGATGNSLANTLTGDDQGNRLDGKQGADVMIGGLGNDTYYVDNTGDVVTELAGQGTDRVISSVSYSLDGTQVERLSLTGTANLDAGGNALGNRLEGNAGNNVINGGGGNDALYGKGGADTFLFNTGSGKDTIYDFSSSQGDKIDISAYSHGTAHAAWITQVGSDVHINMSNGNVITVLGATNNADFQSHIVW